MYDLIITNGCIVDGTGGPKFNADIGINEGKIAKVGSLKGSEAKEVINAEQAVVSPGFIDIHCHSDALLFKKPKELGKILQGVTTEVIGNCGISATPTSQSHLEVLKKYTASIFANIELPWNWSSTGDFLDSLEIQKPISNVASLVGHGTIRIAVMGFDNREPDQQELDKMKRLVASAMDEGAFGMSSGLIYPPGLFSKTQEMIELCKVVAKKNGIYTTHMRGETDDVIMSVNETIKVAAKSGVATQISHHKTAGRDNWGKCRETMHLIDRAREQGLDITCDVYPYIAASTMLGTLLPPWVQEGGVAKLLDRLKDKANCQKIKDDIKNGIPGWENYVKAAGWDNIIIASCKNNKSYEGQSINAVAKAKGVEPADALFEMLIEEEADVLMVVFMMCEDDVSYILKHPAVMVASDAIPSPGKTHPRFFGTFPRVLSKYVRVEKVLSLEEGIKKITSMPSKRLGLKDRGIIKEGMWGDIVIFNPDTISDRATFMKPQQYPDGISYVLVNGKIVVHNNHYTGATVGHVLRKT